jgi:hypothetical protein
MSSRQKRKQARRNGAIAAGTKSPEGIKQSSMNALSHGLFAKALVLTNESQAAFDKLRLEYVNRFQPQDGVEMDLVDDMVGARWRLRRIVIMQTAAFDLQMDKDEDEIKKRFQQVDQPTRLFVAFGNLSNNEKSLQLLMRYETTYSRMYDRAMKALERLQKERSEVEESETYEELQNDVAPTETEPVPQPEIIPSGSEFAEMITKMSPDALVSYLKRVKEKYDASEPQPKSTE